MTSERGYFDQAIAWIRFFGGGIVVSGGDFTLELLRQIAIAIED